MIARLWHGVVSSEKADDYGQYLAGFGVRDYESEGLAAVFRLAHADVGSGVELSAPNPEERSRLTSACSLACASL
jgi:hypothetical protein